MTSRRNNRTYHLAVFLDEPLLYLEPIVGIFIWIIFTFLQSRLIPPYMRTMGMDQRWQDFASVMNFPDSNHASAYHHHHHHYHHHHPSATSNYSSTGSAYSPHMQLPSSSSDGSSRNLAYTSPLSTSLTDLNNVASYSSLSKFAGGFWRWRNYAFINLFITSIR